ncbi:adenosine deaminase [Streptomyces hebeiensis]|uniref:Adenosine deaminase n=2 Tax=Streptomyces hebeiensis TaxID=229486 RepID=A0ABN1UTG2_9ACTN
MAGPPRPPARPPIPYPPPPASDTMTSTTGTTSTVDSTGTDGYLQRLPKTDLHCHLIGTVRATTFAELARRAGLDLPASPETIYRDVNSLPPDPKLYENTRIPVPRGRAADEPEVSYSLFQVSRWIVDALRDADDLTRITYEAFEAAHRTSSVRHLEVSFDGVPPHLSTLGYRGAVEAYAEGIRLAERDFGMSGRLIAAVDRSTSADEALARVREVADNPHEYVAGIGLDNLETAGPPERFADAYRLAGAAGLRRTAHSSEHAPVAHNTITCLDLLGCDRIDHGYYVLEDDAVVARCREERVPFLVAFTTSRRSWRPWRRASIAAMIDAGLNVVLADDDPGLFPTTLTDEYRIAADDLGLGRAKLRAMTLAGVDACWLPEGEKAALRDRFVAELDALDAEGTGETAARTADAVDGDATA